MPVTMTNIIEVIRESLESAVDEVRVVELLGSPTNLVEVTLDNRTYEFTVIERKTRTPKNYSPNHPVFLKTRGSAAQKSDGTPRMTQVRGPMKRSLAVSKAAREREDQMKLTL